MWLARPVVGVAAGSRNDFIVESKLRYSKLLDVSCVQKRNGDSTSLCTDLKQYP